MAKQYVYFGSWGAREHPGSGKGIYYATMDLASGKLEYAGANLNVPDCGMLCISGGKQYIYAANELSRYPTVDEDGLGGAVTALRIRPEDGYPEIINHVPSLGSMPNNICVDSSGRFVLTTNHGTFGVSATYRQGCDGRYVLHRQYDKTSLAMLPVQPDGAIGEVCHLEYFTEKGSAQRYGHDYDSIQYGYGGVCPVSPFHLQASAHLHAVAVDSDGLVVVCNRGSDRIYFFEIDAERKRLKKCHSHRCSLGTGPRHVVFHPTLPYFYIANELQSSILVFNIDRNKKRFYLRQTISTLPEGPAVKNMPADIKIHPSGNHVYCTNRDQNSLSVYSVNPEKGRLRLIQSIFLPGKMPRGFNISSQGDFLLVGLADDNLVVSCRLQSDGRLSEIADRLSVPTPTCVVFGKRTMEET